ncbi:19880_t:CDS:2 [Gigaspora margarita]|uniref:19880_t:CDS:1 n=1 Tax=Gigaspora margarita TaxID=4874 RepID=A0ABM8W4C0_GIGMA|nr:19880_t:CDS:2 [Gigaspora margarita]
MTSNTKEFDSWSDTPPKQAEEEKGWGEPSKNLSKNEDQKESKGRESEGLDKSTENEGWGSTVDKSSENEGWGSEDKVTENEGWGPVDKSTEKEAWGSVNKPVEKEGWGSANNNGWHTSTTDEFAKDYQKHDYQKQDNQFRGRRGEENQTLEVITNGPLIHEVVTINIMNGGKDEPIGDKSPNAQKSGNVNDNTHTPKSENTPYVNKDRVLSGGRVREKVDEEELEKRMQRIRLQNEKIMEKRKMVEEDEEKFRKAEEERKKKELEDQEVQRKLREEEEEERRRRDFQKKQLQEQLDNEREENAKRKTQNRDAREWDKEKEESGWNSPRQQRKGSDIRYSPNNPYVKGGPEGRNNDNDSGNHNRRDSRGNNDYGGYNSRNNESGGYGSRNYRGDSNEYRRPGPRNTRGENNEYSGSRGGYRGGAGDRGRGRGSGGNLRRPVRRYSDQHRSNKSAEEGGFGSGNSWAEQQEQEEMLGKANLPWESDANEDPEWDNSSGWNNSSVQKEEWEKKGVTSGQDDGWGKMGNPDEHCGWD